MLRRADEWEPSLPPPSERGNYPQVGAGQEQHHRALPKKMSGARWRRSLVERPLPDSNRGWRICNPLPVGRNSRAGHRVVTTPSEPLAHSLARKTETDPDLARIVNAWLTLPEPIRRAMLALVEHS